MKENTKLLFNIAIKIYKDPSNQRDLIREDNNGKVGIYSWVNNINGKFYIGSGDPLYLRLSDYYQKWYLLSRNNLYIVKALNKYDMNNFSLIILKYTDSKNVISYEQEFIDLLKPEYNINLIANSSKGYKHSVDSINKMREAALGRKHTDKVKESMSLSRKGLANPFFGKSHSKETLALFKAAAAKRISLPSTAIEVEITDLNTKNTTVYKSIRKAAIAINSDIKTILRREKSQYRADKKGVITPYKKKYILVIKRN